jgi:ubiquinone/menaquinone biosynthesis C-methylase UbiE
MLLTAELSQLPLHDDVADLVIARPFSNKVSDFSIMDDLIQAIRILHPGGTLLVVDRWQHHATTEWLMELGLSSVAVQPLPNSDRSPLCRPLRGMHLVTGRRS